MMIDSRKYVLTGGPFAGKTTVLNIIKEKGYPVVPESARIVIEEEQVIGSNVLPWKNLSQFQMKVVTKQLELEFKASGQHVFLDRGVLDSHAYSKVGKVTSPASVYHDVHLRYAKVFILELLPGYTPDNVRKESAEYREKIHQALYDAYKEFGYDPIVVPALPPQERVAFILECI